MLNNFKNCPICQSDLGGKHLSPDSLISLIICKNDEHHFRSRVAAYERVMFHQHEIIFYRSSVNIFIKPQKYGCTIGCDLLLPDLDSYE